MSDNIFKKLGNLDLSNLKTQMEFSNDKMRNIKNIGNMDEIHQSMMKSQAEKARREEEYKQDILSTLMNIEKNTGDISQLVFLLNANTEKQTEVLEVMTEILSIGTSQTSEEAESKYRKVMGKITQTFEDAETMEKLLSYSKVFYHAAIEYIKHRIENG